MAEKDRIDDFHKTLNTLYGSQDATVLHRIEIEIREQIAFEKSTRTTTSLGHALVELFNKKYIQRTTIAIIVMQLGILSGSLAIQNYQTLMYNSLGFTGRQAILISGCYGFMGIVGQIINLAGVSDRISRVKTMCMYFLKQGRYIMR